MAAQARDFRATNFAICSDGHLMPCIRIGRDDAGLIEVASPGGMIYSYPEERVLSEEEGREQLRINKAISVADNYSFDTIFESDASIVVRCRRGKSTMSDYIITYGASCPRCNCPAWTMEDGCKHVGGHIIHLERAERRAAAEASTRSFDISELRAREEAEKPTNCVRETPVPQPLEIAAADW
jgi:hypothetical protein